MIQVLPQSGGERLRGKVHASQHPFDDVAVMAEQPSRLPAVVAMVGANLSAAEGSLANCASVALKDQEGIDLLSAKTSPAPTLVLDPLRPSFRIGPQPLVSRFALRLRFRGLVEGSSAGGGLWRIGALLATRLHLWSLMIFAALRAYSVAILDAVLAMPFKMTSPLFWGAIGFPHSSQMTPYAGRLNRACDLKGALQ